MEYGLQHNRMVSYFMVIFDSNILSVAYILSPPPPPPLKGGGEEIVMSLEGSIKDFGLADIFQLITLQKKSGIMTVTRGDESTTIHFDSGQIVYATAIIAGDTK